MEVTKIVPIAIGFTGLGIMLFAVSQSSKNKKAGAYLDASLTDSSFNAKEVATMLYDAMKEANFTNTEKRKSIFTALTGVSEAQFSQVIKAFGSRYYNTLTGNTYFALWQTPVKHPLKIWLKEELSEEDYKLLKSNYPKQL
ncbi:hypothetical protein [Flavobacterium aquatile]|uniref:Annexin n=1 Tax=Flavobacterium aquatile LMG 4008 = ATCC 11947 TaxID=1453498 RepID=A0A095UWH7_9FLAO|nr:hypothetical protein [Flavobacterium aquatile]KGD66930.1 hypothetical protein LG45_16015 [Flavobacterium aquatile LMG 4008 = ATCC 11947]OXA68023.1 hypothetical protein B0A61_06025 [Flavobacterium aquatile LMG 4008 = ATCC 11947]GEC80143.1 hypothetical protein FAQ01_30130 [Flavobacterium aquatile]